MAAEPLAVSEREGTATLLAEMFANLPADIAYLEGPELVFTFANATYLGWLGGREHRRRDITDGLRVLAHAVTQVARPSTGAFCDAAHARLLAHRSQPDDGCLLALRQVESAAP